MAVTCMSDEPGRMKASALWTLRVCFAALAILAPIAAWRLSCRLVAPKPYAPTAFVLPVRAPDAESIAVAEVKKREGWSGRASVCGVEASDWEVEVWREPKSEANTRWVGVNAYDRHVSTYTAAVALPTK
jgi:hypothetical protein